jgi:hypothetical protein
MPILPFTKNRRRIIHQDAPERHFKGFSAVFGAGMSKSIKY